MIIESSKKDGEVEAHILERLKEYLLIITHKQNILRERMKDNAKDQLKKMFEENKELLLKLEKRLENDNKI